MKKKYLYIIIIVLVLCIMGFISIPFLQNTDNCDVNSSGKMYFRLGPISIPLNINGCERG